jgi:hypothetical protein
VLFIQTGNTAGCQISNLWTAWCFLDFFTITNRVPYEKEGYTFLQINTFLMLHNYSVQQTLRSIARFGSLLDKTTVIGKEARGKGLWRHVMSVTGNKYKGFSVDHHDLINNKTLINFKLRNSCNESKKNGLWSVTAVLLPSNPVRKAADRRRIDWTDSRNSVNECTEINLQEPQCN